MNFPLYIAKRYLFSKSNKNAVNIISRIAVVAVVVGAMALFIVLSGFAGLRDFSLQFTNVFDSDLKVLPATGKTLTFSENASEAINQIEGIEAFSTIIEERVSLQYKGKNHIAFIKGVDKNFGLVNPIDSILFFRNWFSPNADEAVIGLGTANKLSLNVQDYNDLLEIYVPKPGTGQINRLDPSEAFNKESTVVSGIYSVNEELDNKYVFTEIDFARRLLNLDSTTISSVEFKLEPGAEEAAIRRKIAAVFSEETIIKNRIQQNDALYKMLNAENLFVYIFVSLIAAIAIFNIAGTIIMMILEKKSNIRTLISLGLTLKQVRAIFFYEGFLMTLIGAIIGLLLGVTAVLLQRQFGFIPITPSLPYPVRFEWINLLIVFTTIAALGGIASKIAARRISPTLLR
ncbi:MAG: FtsX-like permease family protein [Flavobacteriales bacterium]|nr:FtsX-like permease family protein [Flavobacteriales bacterium]